MEGDITVKRGRKATEKVNKTFEVVLKQNGETMYQNVQAVDFGEAGKMADGLARVLKATVKSVNLY